MKTLITTLAVSLLTFCVYSQNYEVPENYKLKVAADYDTYESELLQSIAWLKVTPLDKDEKKREKATKFVMDWVNGSPDVMVLIDINLISFIDTSPHLLFYFIAGWTEKSVMTEKHDDNLTNAMAGIETAIQFYKNNIGLTGKDKNLEKLIKLQDKDKLEAHVKKKLGSNL